jgi:hypothetical protein
MNTSEKEPRINTDEGRLTQMGREEKKGNYGWLNIRKGSY